MQPHFDSLGVRVVALSRDPVEKAARHFAEDRLDPITLLSDAELTVIRRFGLEHQKALTVTSPVIRPFGLPLGIPRGFESMAIPTTILVDERGVIRWIDQASDYRLRSDQARVDAALAEAFGGAPPSAPTSS